MKKMLIILVGLFLLLSCKDEESKKVEINEAKEYAAAHFSRERQLLVQSKMTAFFEENYELNVYTGNYWHLSQADTDYYYEDISKFDKYIFGWDDWFEKYAATYNQSSGEWEINEILWAHEEGVNSIGVWLGNYSLSGNPETYDTPFSTSRERFVELLGDYFDEE